MTPELVQVQGTTRKQILHIRLGEATFMASCCRNGSEKTNLWFDNNKKYGLMKVHSGDLLIIREKKLGLSTFNRSKIIKNIHQNLIRRIFDMYRTCFKSFLVSCCWNHTCCELLEAVLRIRTHFFQPFFCSLQEPPTAETINKSTNTTTTNHRDPSSYLCYWCRMMSNDSDFAACISISASLQLSGSMGFQFGYTTIQWQSTFRWEIIAWFKKK